MNGSCGIEADAEHFERELYVNNVLDQMERMADTVTTGKMNCDSEDSDEYFSDEEDVVYYNLMDITSRH